MANGAKSFYAKAYDSAGDSTNSATVSLTVNNITNMPGQSRWVRTMRGSSTGNETIVNGAVADHHANTVIAGQFSGTLDPGDGISRSSTGGSGWDIFIVKYNAQGELLWFKQIAGGANEMAYGVAVDSADNIIVTGTFGLNQAVTGFDLGGGLLSGLGGQNIFVAKYSSAGAYVWAKSFGGPFSNYGCAIAVDGSDDIFVGGNFYAGPIDFGGGALYGTATDVFLLKLNSAGAYVWAKSYGGVGEQNLRSLAVDRAGGVIVAGYYAGTANFGAGPVTSQG